jgi:hypothetical protein
MAMELSPEEKMAFMDQAAVEATKVLRAMHQRDTVPVARWWRDNYGKAGHKRLGRVLVAFAKETATIKDEDLA